MDENETIRNLEGERIMMLATLAISPGYVGE